VTILPAEFRVLDASDGDIYAMGPDSIKIRAMRVFGVVCDTPVLGGALGNRGVTVRNSLTFGSRAFTRLGLTADLLRRQRGYPDRRWLGER